MPRDDLFKEQATKIHLGTGKQASSLLRGEVSHAGDKAQASFVFISVWTFEELLHLLFVTEAKGDGSGTSDGVRGEDVAAQLGRVSLVSVTLGASTAGLGAGTHDTRVDGAGDAVILLDVDLGHLEDGLIVGGVLLDISARRAIDEIPGLETSNGLVLGHSSSTEDASNSLRDTLVLLSSSVVPSL